MLTVRFDDVFSSAPTADNHSPIIRLHEHILRSCLLDIVNHLADRAPLSRTQAGMSRSLGYRSFRVAPRCSEEGGSLELGMSIPRIGSLDLAAILSDAFLLQLHVQSQAADFVGEHVEAGGRAGFQRVLALDHRFVNLGPALHVIRFDRQQLLQDVGGAVGFQRPHFHLAETLTAEAGLAAQAAAA